MDMNTPTANAAQEATDEVSFRFVSEDSISLESKQAFSERATEKLIDFYNYLNIVSDSSYDTIFRKKAEELLYKLCIDEHIKVIISQNGSKKLIALNELSSQLLKGGITFNAKPLDNAIFITDTSFIKNLNSFTGSLSYSIMNENVNTEFYIKKTEKIFGEKKEKVWEVLLGSTAIDSLKRRPI
ncbi:MAG: hypothetical protein A3K10_00135 [Bacteroidetes bacterium RIFCSPLOWO2_12_FULL_31_6]|nr:MAG: hypothetical protein A3K10_00135 [Bacteroidetes bacterium RIFCSPLOWO2_12_FULL_31_6]